MSLSNSASFARLETAVSAGGVEATEAMEPSTVTESATVETEPAGAAASARAAWWREALRRFLSLWARPR